jgi:hypothetical protein
VVEDPKGLVSEVFGAFNEAGAEGFLDYLAERDALHPDFMMEIQRDAPNGGQWRGPEGFREMARIWLEVWDVFEVHPDEPIEVAPDRYVVPVRQRAVAHGSGLEINERFFYTVQFADGRFWRVGLFVDRPRADRYLAGEGY